MSYYHGVSTKKQATSISTPVEADCGIHLIVGCAPVHSVAGKVNEPILCYTYKEAVEQLGYSDDWGKYDICEEIYSAFKLYAIAPVAFVNVLDPSKHKSEEKTTEVTLKDGVAELSFETLADTVVVKGYNGEVLTDSYVRGTDYELLYADGVLNLEKIDGGAITSDFAKLNVTYKEVDPSKVTKADVIGGYDVTTKKNKGLELVNAFYPKYQVIPELLLVPRFSSDSEVAAVMSAKVENINGLFKGKAIIDVDTTTVQTYTDVPAWKNSHNINQSSQLAVWPMVMLGDKKFHHSIQLAGCMTATDMNEELGDGAPFVSASNKTMQIDGLCLANGTEVLLDLTSANYLNANGIITALNLNGFVSWGNESACYPANTDVTDYFYCISRMFAWVAKNTILSVWSKVDSPLNRRLIESITDSMNIWLNGLTSEGKILGGTITFSDAENTDVDLMAGKATFHIMLTPPSPAKELDFVLEYDSSYLSTIVG